MGEIISFNEVKLRHEYKTFLKTKEGKEWEERVSKAFGPNTADFEKYVYFFHTNFFNSIKC